MSDEGLNKIKDLFKAKSEEVAEKAGQKLGEAAFEMKKAMDAASPMARSAMTDLANVAKSALGSFEKAMEEAEARARARAAAAASTPATPAAAPSANAGQPPTHP